MSYDVQYNWNDVLTLTMRGMRKEINDQIMTECPVLDILSKLGGVDYRNGGIDEDGDLAVTIPLMYGRSPNFKILNGKYDKLKSDPYDGVTACTFKIKIATDTIVIPWLDELAQGGGHDLVSLLDTKKEQVVSNVKSQIEKIVIGVSTEANRPTSLLYICFPKSAAGATTSVWNTLGRIPRATKTWWQNQVRQAEDLSTLPLRLQLQRLSDDCFFASGKRPNVFITDRIAWQYYGDEVDEKISLQSTGKLAKADLAYPVLWFDGHPVVPSADLVNPDDANKGIILAPNTKATKYTIFKPLNMYIGKFKGPFDEDQLIRKAPMLHGCCCTTKESRANGVIANITKT